MTAGANYLPTSVKEVLPSSWPVDIKASGDDDGLDVRSHRLLMVLFYKRENPLARIGKEKWM